MPTLWIVEAFDVVEQVRTGLVPGGVLPSVYAPSLEHRE